MKQAFIEILRSTVDERRALFSAVASDMTSIEELEHFLNFDMLAAVRST